MRIRLVGFRRGRVLLLIQAACLAVCVICAAVALGGCAAPRPVRAPAPVVIYVPVPVPTPTWSVNFGMIPNDPALKGVTVLLQAVYVTPPPLRLDFTNAVLAILGT